MTLFDLFSECTSLLLLFFRFNYRQIKFYADTCSSSARSNTISQMDRFPFPAGIRDHLKSMYSGRSLSSMLLSNKIFFSQRRSNEFYLWTMPIFLYPYPRNMTYLGFSFGIQIASVNQVSSKYH